MGGEYAKYITSIKQNKAIYLKRKINCRSETSV